jgi:hypothetical protein
MRSNSPSLDAARMQSLALANNSHQRPRIAPVLYAPSDERHSLKGTERQRTTLAQDVTLGMISRLALCTTKANAGASTSLRNSYMVNRNWSPGPIIVELPTSFGHQNQWP